jgi:hypothetical protein
VRLDMQTGQVMATASHASGTLASASAQQASQSAAASQAQAHRAQSHAQAALASQTEAAASVLACAAYVDTADALVASPYTRLAADLISTQAVMVEHHAFT